MKSVSLCTLLISPHFEWPWRERISMRMFVQYRGVLVLVCWVATLHTLTLCAHAHSKWGEINSTSLVRSPYASYRPGSRCEIVKISGGVCPRPPNCFYTSRRSLYKRSVPMLCPSIRDVLLYIDDVTNGPFSPGTRTVLYADDILLYCTISSNSDYSYLQSDAKRVQDWVNCNHMFLNPSKCKFMLISRKWNRIDTPPLLLRWVKDWDQSL